MALKLVGRKGAAVLFFVSLSWILPQSATAADPVGRMSVALRFGMSGLDMGEVNSAISRSNHNLATEPLSQDWDVPDRIHSGFIAGGDLAYDLTSNLRLGLLYEQSWAKSDVDFNQVISVEPRTKMFVPRLSYRLPWRPLTNMSMRAFGGVVLLKDVKTKVTHEVTSKNAPRLESLELKGSGSGFEAGVMTEYTLADRFSLMFEGGYRRAKAGFDSGSWTISKLRDPGSDDDHDGIPNERDLSETSYLWGFLNEPAQQSEEPTVRGNLDQDFSGVVARIGLRIYVF
ncbi:MAG: hypothetical protein ACE15D_05785 [Candidatus Eisenbacteria bacterium]